MKMAANRRTGDF